MSGHGVRDDRGEEPAVRTLLDEEGLLACLEVSGECAIDETCAGLLVDDLGDHARADAEGEIATAGPPRRDRPDRIEPKIDDLTEVHAPDRADDHPGTLLQAPRENGFASEREQARRADVEVMLEMVHASILAHGPLAAGVLTCSGATEIPPRLPYRERSCQGWCAVATMNPDTERTINLGHDS